MNSLVLIDSSAWLFTLGPHPVSVIRDRVTYLLEQNLGAITSPILFEILSGTKNPMDSQQLKAYLLSLHLFPYLPEDWLEAAAWTQSLRKADLKLKTIDAIIACKAVKHNLILLHADEDLDRIARKSHLKVESYVDEVRKMRT